jgi:hypothetical protein
VSSQSELTVISASCIARRTTFSTASAVIVAMWSSAGKFWSDNLITANLLMRGAQVHNLALEVGCFVQKRRRLGTLLGFALGKPVDLVVQFGCL